VGITAGQDAMVHPTRTPLGARLGSKDPNNMGQDEPLEAGGVKLIGYTTIFFGFLFQSAALIASRLGR
jgi:hypothetical protein